MRDPCYDAPLPSAPTPGFDHNFDLDPEASINIFSYLALPLTHPTTFTILFTALFFVLTVIPATVCLSLSLARHRPRSTLPAIRKSNPVANEEGDTIKMCEKRNLLSVWRVPFGSPVYYVDTRSGDSVIEGKVLGDMQDTVLEKDNSR